MVTNIWEKLHSQVCLGKGGDILCPYQSSVWEERRQLSRPWLASPPSSSARGVAILDEGVRKSDIVALGLDIVEAGARADAGVAVLHAGTVAAAGVGIDDDAGVPVAALAGPSGGVAIFFPFVEAQNPN